MVRADRIWPDVYFGRPGALIKMPWPRDGIEKPFDRPVYEFITGSGQRQVSSLLGGSRLFVMKWRALHVDTYTALERFWTGNAGAGPWIFIDPSMRNILMGNIAAATSMYYDTREIYTLTGAADMGDLISNKAGGTTQHNPYSVRSLQWRFLATPATSPTLTFGVAYRSWYGYPIVPGKSYVWSFWARPDGTVDTSVNLTARIKYYSAAGVEVADATGGDTVVSGWTRVSCTSVAPSNAAYCMPRIIATGSTITTGASIFFDEFMLEQDIVVNDWAPGTGNAAVEIISLTEQVPFDANFRQEVTMTLRELAV